MEREVQVEISEDIFCNNLSDVLKIILIGGKLTGGLAIILAISTPYLFGTKEKRELLGERDKIVNALKTAQQNSVSCQKN